jgi:hypothetical protein
MKSTAFSPTQRQEKIASFRQRPRKRPFGVSVIIFMLLLYILLFCNSLLSLFKMPFGEFTLDIFQTVNPTYTPVLLILVILMGLVLIVGLFQLQRWAWVLVMVLTGLRMLFDLWGYFYGNYSFLSMVINIIIVFYLNQREVQRAFSGRTDVQPDHAAEV